MISRNDCFTPFMGIQKSKINVHKNKERFRLCQIYFL